MTDAATLLLIALLAMLAMARRERALDVLLGYEDPRPLARFRVALASLLLVNAVSLHLSGELLYSDAGLLTTAGARYTHALSQFDDVLTPGRWTLLKYPLGTSWSLLHFWDSPLAVQLHFATLYAALLGLLVGKWTTVSKWSALALYLSTWSRNFLPFAGEQVLTISLLLLCFSDCGAACSLDARATPLRPIPRWPRVLLALQLILIYFANAVAKDGATWMNGQGVHYALTNHLHARWAVRAHAGELAPALWAASHLTLALEFGFALTVIHTLRSIPGPRARPTLGTRALAVAAAAVGAYLFAAVYRPATELGAAPWVWLSLGAGAGLVVCLALETPVGARLLATVSAPRLWIPFGLLFHLGLFATLSVDVLALSPAALYLLLDNGAPELSRARSRSADARVLTPLELLVYLAGSGAVIAAAPEAWPWLTLAAASLLIARAWRRRVPRRRVLAPAFCTVHVAAALLYALPHERPRTPAVTAISRPFATWTSFTRTYQDWMMYAPDPPTQEAFVYVFGIDARGRRASIVQSPNAPDSTRRPILGRHKREKSFRMSAARPWARPWLARYACLRGGPQVERVELVRRTVPALAFGASETDEAWARRAQREAQDTTLLAFRCADLLHPPNESRLLAWQPRSGAPSPVPWHILLIGLWIVARRCIRREAGAPEPVSSTT